MPPEVLYKIHFIFIGAGSFAFNLITGYLLEKYGWRGTILIQAGILLNGIVCGLIFVSPQASGDKIRSRERNGKQSDVDHEEAMCLNPTESSTSGINFDNIKNNFECNYMPVAAVDINRDGQETYEVNSEIYGNNYTERFDNFEDSTTRNSGKAISRSSDMNFASGNADNKEGEAKLQWKTSEDKEVDSKVQMNIIDVKKDKGMCNELCDVSLLQNAKLLAFLLSGFFVNLAFTIPFNFVPDQAIENGMDKHEAYWLASSMGKLLLSI